MAIGPRTRVIVSVRNPYTRIVSALFTNSIINITFTPDKVYSALQRWVQTVNDNHTLPQSEFVVDALGNIVPNLCIVHQETLAEDMAKLGYTNFNVVENVNRKLPKAYYMNYLNADSITLINTMYAKEFSMFGYDMILPKPQV